MAIFVYMATQHINENSVHNSLVLDVYIFNFNNLTFLLHKRINVLHSPTNIFSHSPFKSVNASSTFSWFFSLAFSFSNFQTFSIGFMSGLWAGHSVTVTSSSERNVLTGFAVWHGALSYINTVGWLIAFLKFSTTCFFNISFYTVALILPRSLTRGPVSVIGIIPNTITSYSKF